MAIFEVNSKTDYENLIKDKSFKFLGKGNEGECHLLSDYKVYKIYNGNLDIVPEANKIITSDIIKSYHFIFPNQVYTVNGKVVGTQSNYVPVLDKTHSMLELEDNFIDALYSFASELYNLSLNGFVSFDFGTNFIFDGYDLFDIDTLGHSFDLENKYDRNFLTAYNMQGFLNSVSTILGEDMTPKIKTAWNDIYESYINQSLDTMMSIRK